MTKGNYIEALQESKCIHYDKKENLIMTDVF